ncbi:hypothetical protein SUDANB15_00223 [Streptomyces sp. enrichment culture]
MRGRVPEVHEGGRAPVDEDQPVLRTRAHSPLPRPGRKSGLVPFVHNGPSSATSPAIRSADRPVILRSLTIAARDAFPTTRP